MSDSPKLPFSSPVEPVQLSPSSKLKFNCYPGISCFNACCKQADITLAPYDIIRLKNRLGMSSGEFLKAHTVPFEMDSHGMPGVKMRTQDQEPVCLLMEEGKGCSVYTDRPSACRYYPVALMAARKADEYQDRQYFALVKEEHCKGHEQEREISVEDYRREQEVEDYDQLNREFYQLILKKKSAGPSVGKPSPTSFQFFFMVCYDTDRFRQFLESASFRNVYQLPEQEYQEILDDDVARLKFGYRLLRQVLFGENTIDMVDGVFEKRMAERGEILARRREAEIENERQQAPFEKFLDD